MMIQYWGKSNWSQKAFQRNTIGPIPRSSPPSIRTMATKVDLESRLSFSKMKEKYCPSDEAQKELVEQAVVWASLHGLTYGAGLSGELSSSLVHAPVSLFPVLYPARTFHQAKKATLAFNTMIDAVSRDDEFLHQTLESAARSDPFTKGLLMVHQNTRKERETRVREGKDINLAINRSDYMLHSPTDGLLQVELNTIASSFGCLSTIVSQMHRYILDFAGATEQEIKCLPPNKALDGIVDVLAAAHELTSCIGSLEKVVLMVVQPEEQNSFDQQWIQTTLWEKHRVRTLRRTLAEIHGRGHLDAKNQLIIDDKLVSVVYFRAGYSPDDYHGDAEWKARELVERSNAAACPTVSMQLAGSKKVQQELAKQEVLDRYAATKEDASLMQQLFAGLWGLDDLENDEEAVKAVENAISRPDDYVLKPQREGGGNNIYGQEVREYLESGTDLSSYILMQRIRPPLNTSIMVRKGKAIETDTLSELGIYGTYLRHGSSVLFNHEVGHLVRTKASTSDEGGVAAGFAVLDSPYLLENY